jgi:hypothetical protein
MNERIKLLDKQAVDYALSVCDANGVYQGKEYLAVAKEKFAELIVRECVSKLDDIGVIDRDSRTIAMKVISEHFGVEE